MATLSFLRFVGTLSPTMRVTTSIPSSSSSAAVDAADVVAAAVDAADVVAAAVDAVAAEVSICWRISAGTRLVRAVDS